MIAAPFRSLAGHSFRHVTRLLAWTVIILSLVIIYNSPIRLTVTGDPLQSLASLSDPVVFSFLFLASASMSIYVSTRTSETELGRVAALAAFALSFGTAFWEVSQRGFIFENANFGSDALFTSLIGHVPTPTFYQGEPGTGILVSLLHSLTGGGILETIAFMSIVESVVFMYLSYLLFRWQVGSPRVAALGSVLLLIADYAIGGSIGDFWPQTFGALVFFPILVLTLGKLGTSGRSLLVGTIVILSSVSVHFLTSVIIVVFLTLLSFFKIVRHEDGRLLSYAAVSTAALVAYQVLTAGVYIPILKTLPSVLVNALTAPSSMTGGAGISISSSGIAPFKLPLWVSAPQFFWLCFMAAAAMCGLYELFRARLPAIIGAGILTGVSFMALGVLFIPVAGFGLGVSLTRGMLFVGLFIMLAFCGITIRRHLDNEKVFLIFVSLLILTSLPVSLANHAGVAAQGYDAADMKVGSFLSNFLPQGSQVYGVSSGFPALQYYLVFKDPPCPIYSTFYEWNANLQTSLNGTIQQEERIVNSFLNKGCGSGVLVYSATEWGAPYVEVLHQSNAVQLVEGVSIPLAYVSKVYNSNSIQVLALVP